MKKKEGRLAARREERKASAALDCGGFLFDVLPPAAPRRRKATPSKKRDVDIPLARALRKMRTRRERKWCRMLARAASASQSLQRREARSRVAREKTCGDRGSRPKCVAPIFPKGILSTSPLPKMAGTKLKARWSTDQISAPPGFYIF